MLSTLRISAAALLVAAVSAGMVPAAELSKEEAAAAVSLGMDPLFLAGTDGGGSREAMEGCREGCSSHVVFRAVPVASWKAGKPDRETVLDDATVHLFEDGEYAPSLSVAANEPVDLPPGAWSWLVEAPEWVSVTTGSLRLDALPAEAAAPREVFVPVVPACSVTLDPSARWQGVRRVDVLGLDRGTVHPVVLSHRQTARVPAGRLIAYSVGTGGSLDGIGSVFRCARGEELVVGRPAPPAAGALDLMASYGVLAGVASTDPALVIALAEPAGSRSRRPTVLLRQEGRLTAFFLGAPAAGDRWSLGARHPELLTSKREVATAGGEALEMPLHVLKPRVTVEIDVDYRPRIEHQREEIAIEYRGLDWPRREISEMGPPQPLLPGFQRYSFAGLDTGSYRAVAFVDDAVMPGAGDLVAFAVAADAEEAPGPFSTILRELEIYGHILMDGDPVPGEVRRRRSAATLPAGAPATEVFRTDDDLLYHWTFFASRRIPDLDRDKPPEEALRGFFGGDVRACADAGPCRTLGSGSMIVEEGRLDIELLEGRELRVIVRDAGDDSPVEQATVAANHGLPKVIMAGGEARWHPADEDDPAVASPALTDADGIAEIRIAESFRTRLYVGKEGYEDHTSIVPAGSGPSDIEISLRPEEEPTVPVVLRLGRGGPPLPGAVLIALRPGGFDRGCVVVTDAEGRFDGERDCLAGADLVLLDGRALIERFPAAVVAGSAELVAAPAPPQPIRLRVTGSDGPVAAVPLRFAFPDFTLSQFEISAASSHGGRLFFFPWTDQNGEAILRGVDPWSATPVTIVADHPAWRGQASLFEIDAEGALELRVAGDE